MTVERKRSPGALCWHAMGSIQGVGRHGSSNDPLQFCNVLEGSELEKEVLKTQKCHKDGCSFVFTIPTSKIPGVLYVAPTKDFKVLVWDVCVCTNDLPTSNIFTKNNNDSTRRRGVPI